MDNGVFIAFASVISTVVSAVVGCIVYLYRESKKCFEESVQYRIDRAVMEQRLHDMEKDIQINRETAAAAASDTRAAAIAASQAASVAATAIQAVIPPERPSGINKVLEKSAEEPYAGPERRAT